MFQLSGKAFLLSRISWNTFSFFILPKIKWWKLKYSNFWPKPWTNLAPCWEKCNCSTFSSSFFFCPERLCFQSRISPHTFSSLLLTPATQGSFSPLAFPFFYACHQAYVGKWWTVAASTALSAEISQDHAQLYCLFRALSRRRTTVTA